MALVTIRKSHVLAAAAVLVALAAAPIYKWVDEQGRTHYSDQPPAEEHEAEEFELLPPPVDNEVREARARLDRLLDELEAGREVRAAAREQERLERQLAEAERVQRLRRCLRARENLHALRQQRPVYHIDEKGELVFLDDAQRAAEIRRMQTEIETFCD